MQPEMTDSCRALVDGVRQRMKKAERRALLRPRAERQAFIYGETFQNEIEAVAFFLAEDLGRIPNFATPTTYPELMRGQFLTHPNPLMSIAADKIAMRDYCDLFDLPIRPPKLLATFDNPDDLDPRDLPPNCMVKIADGCKMHVLNGPGLPLTPFAYRFFLWKYWHIDHWRRHAELHYRDIPKRVLVEEALLPIDKLHDCGVYCAMGEPYMFFTKTYRTGGKSQRRSYIALDRKLDCLTGNARETQDLYDLGPRDQIDAMIETARILSKPFLNCRVDFMRVGNRTVIGEITLSPGALHLLPDDPEIEIIRGNLLDMERLDDLLAEGRRIAAELGWPTETSFGHYAKDDPRLTTAGQ